MKLVEFYALASGADRNDPLMSIVKNLKDEKERLVELRRQSQGFLIPITSKGKTTIAADPDLSEDVADLAAQVESCKARIADSEDMISDVDEIYERYSIERPLLRELRHELGVTKNGIIRAKEKVAGTLGHVLSFEKNFHDEERAKQHPKYLKAVKEYETRKAHGEPKIERLEAVLAELQAVLRDHA